jgi:ubiquinone/menaquinone biosynthesis C-methylase UbiE
MLSRIFAHDCPEYGLPMDDDELDRLDMNHHKYTLLQGNKLFLAPISPTPQKILDLGTGTGIDWCEGCFKKVNP